jgi:hypothetical protein
MTQDDLISYQDSDGIFLETKDPLTEYYAVFEDNGKVAYAYLIKNKQVVGDVWLYNHGSPKLEIEWKDPSKMPFSNPLGFALETNFSPITNIEEVEFSWIHDSDGNFLEVKIKLFGEEYGKLKEGSKPGWSKLAIKDGPLAKAMDKISL